METRELSISEIEMISGGVDLTSDFAGGVLAVYGASITSGAIVGGLAAGPGGMLAGALAGAMRVSFTFAFGALIGGAYIGSATVSEVSTGTAGLSASDS